MAQPKIEYDLDGTDKCLLGDLHYWTISTSIGGKPTDLAEAISAKMWMEDPTRGLMEVRVRNPFFLHLSDSDREISRKLKREFIRLNLLCLLPEGGI